jgi:hypothetical protein
MDDQKIRDAMEKVYKRANIGSKHAQPVYDLPIDRVLAMKVAEVVDLIGHLTLLELFRGQDILMENDSRDRDL